MQAAFIRGIRDVAVGDLAEPEPTGDELLIEVEAVGICGSIVLVGIPEGDGYALQAYLARRKGLGVRFSRRMGHVYPRAIELVRRGQVDVRRIATHHFPLAAAPEAFARQAERSQGIIKGILHPDGRLPAG